MLGGSVSVWSVCMCVFHVLCLGSLHELATQSIIIIIIGELVFFPDAHRRPFYSILFSHRVIIIITLLDRADLKHALPVIQPLAVPWGAL